MEKFVITIARGFGSGGRTIGKMLSERLGVEYYDKDILKLASETSGINEQLFAQTDEKAQNAFFSKPKKYTGDIKSPSSSDFLSPENLFSFQAATIKTIAEKESCIIVGRCADFILDGRKDLIKAFIWADDGACADNVMRLYSVDKAEAQKKIEKIDKERRAYYKQHTGQEWDDVRNYDICLNTSDLGFEKCVDIICEYVRIKTK